MPLETVYQSNNVCMDPKNKREKKRRLKQFSSIQHFSISFDVGVRMIRKRYYSSVDLWDINVLSISNESRFQESEALPNTSEIYKLLYLASYVAPGEQGI